MELPVISKVLYNNITSAYKKYYKCNKCNYTSSTLWNLKKHTAETHISIKEKKKLPFYCKICDSTSISQLYYDKHLNSDIHKNKIKSLIEEKEEKDEKEESFNIDANIKKYIDDCINKMKNDIIAELKNITVS